MRPVQKCLVALLILLSITLQAQKSKSGQTLRLSTQLTGNKAPVAVAGSDIFLPAGGREAILDGKNSYDPDGRIRKYLWKKISGPVGDTIVSPGSMQTKVIFLNTGVYTYQLKVTDNKSATATDDAMISIAADSGTPEMLLVDWNTVTLPVDGLPDARRFADNRLRSSTAYDPFSKTVVGDKMRFIVDSQTPVDPTISSAQYHYRAEFTEWPWNINLAEGTEQWVGWSYYFAYDYVIPVKPISIFQNHPATSSGDPLFQLEIARPGQISGALGGEIQIINNCVTPYLRKLTSIRPMPGDRLDVIIHVVYGFGSNGLLQIWLNDQKVHDVVGNTIFAAPENWGGNNKWGIYHHTWTNPLNVEACIAAGHTKFELLMGSLRQITRTSVDSDYLNDYRSVVDPSQDPDTRASSARIRPENQTAFVEREMEGFSVYPVPLKSGDELGVIGKTPESIILVNQLGQPLNVHWNADTKKINTEGMAPGVYWLKAVIEGRTIQKRIIVLR